MVGGDIFSNCWILPGFGVFGSISSISLEIGRSTVGSWKRSSARCTSTALPRHSQLYLRSQRLSDERTVDCEPYYQYFCGLGILPAYPAAQALQSWPVRHSCQGAAGYRCHNAPPDYKFARCAAASPLNRNRASQERAGPPLPPPPLRRRDQWLAAIGSNFSPLLIAYDLHRPTRRASGASRARRLARSSRSTKKR